MNEMEEYLAYMENYATEALNKENKPSTPTHWRYYALKCPSNTGSKKW